MSITMNFKKGRLIWEECLENLSSLAVEPKVSFDEGVTWMTLISKAANLRTGSKVTDSSIKYIGDGWNQVDVGFGFTPYAIPAIVNHKVVPDAENGKEPGTYYYILKCINKDSPGLEETLSNTYDASNTENNHSKVYTVTITEKSNITLYVNFAEYVSGIYLYEGYSIDDSTFPITLKLSYISNLCNPLLETLSSTADVIWLKHKIPFPKEGIVKINNEYISYNDCTFEEKEVDSGVSYWKLSVAQRGYLSTTPAEHVVSSDPYFANVSVMLANHKAGTYGELPDKQFAKPVITDNQLYQFLNFDEETVEDISINSETSLPNTSPTKLGQIMFDNTTVTNGYSMRLAGKGLIDTGVNVTKNMTLYSSIRLDNIEDYLKTENSLPPTTENDPYIFGTLNGIWLRVSRLNIKPYLGFKDSFITNLENINIPSLAINEYHSIGVSWSIDAETDNMRFTIYLNGKFVQTIVSNIKSTEFLEERIYIGGVKYTTTEYLNPIEAFYDEWRIYKRELALSDYTNLELERSKLNNIWCGKLEINNKSLCDYSVIDSSTAMNIYDPLFNLSYEFDSSSSLYGSGSDFSTIYDDTLLSSYMTSGMISDDITFTYPIDASKIQARFNLEGDGTGFNTPKIRNIAVIVSEGSVS